MCHVTFITGVMLSRLLTTNMFIAGRFWCCCFDHNDIMAYHRRLGRWPASDLPWDSDAYVVSAPTHEEARTCSGEYICNTSEIQIGWSPRSERPFQR
jgi:hypothetical protein